MSVVDQHVELQKKILAENTAEVRVVRPDILHVELNASRLSTA